MTYPPTPAAGLQYARCRARHGSSSTCVPPVIPSNADDRPRKSTMIVSVCTQNDYVETCVPQRRQLLRARLRGNTWVWSELPGGCRAYDPAEKLRALCVTRFGRLPTGSDDPGQHGWVPRRWRNDFSHRRPGHGRSSLGRPGDWRTGHGRKRRHRKPRSRAQFRLRQANIPQGRKQIYY